MQRVHLKNLAHWPVVVKSLNRAEEIIGQPNSFWTCFATPFGKVLYQIICLLCHLIHIYQIIMLNENFIFNLHLF